MINKHTRVPTDCYVKFRLFQSDISIAILIINTNILTVDPSQDHPRCCCRRTVALRVGGGLTCLWLHYPKPVAHTRPPRPCHSLKAAYQKDSRLTNASANWNYVFSLFARLVDLCGQIDVKKNLRHNEDCLELSGHTKKSFLKPDSKTHSESVDWVISSILVERPDLKRIKLTKYL